VCCLYLSVCGFCIVMPTCLNFYTGTKGENFDIKSKDIAGYHPMLCVFDILLYNGQILANKPLRTRRQILDNVFNAVEGRLILSEFTEKQSRSCLIQSKWFCIDSKHW